MERADAKRAAPQGAPLDIHAGAAKQFELALEQSGVAFELRTHEPPRHARHLAALWGIPLHEAGRATLFGADDLPVLALVPADRKVSAPRLRALLGADVLCVLRGDRGVGRIGWTALPGAPGALPAVPGLFGARCVVDELVLCARRVVVSLGGGRSVALLPQDYVRATAADVAQFAGSTRLLPGGGLVDDPPTPRFA